MARGIGDEWYRAGALEALAPYVAKAGRIEEALEVARGIGDERYRARALEALVHRLAEAGRVEGALRAAQGIGDEGYRARAWRRCARLAEAGRVEEALGLARGIGDEGYWASALEAMAPRLAEAGCVERRWGWRGTSATIGPGPAPWRPWVNSRRRWKLCGK